MGGGNQHLPDSEQDEHAFTAGVCYEQARNSRQGANSFGKILDQVALVLVIALGGALAVNVLLLALHLG